MEKKKRTKRLPVGLTEAEFKKLTANTEREHHKLAFLLGFAAGLRVSEVVNLEKRHIRNDGSILIELGKGGKDRIVPIPKGFKKKHLTSLPIGVGSRALQKAFLSCCKRAGLLENKPNLHFHSLRHGFALQCLESGMPLNHLQVLLGHANIATTSQYLRANPKDAIKSYEENF